MALLVNTSVAKAGTVTVLAAANAGGDTVPRRDNGFLLVKNPTGGAITLTIDTPGTTHGLAIADQGIAIAAGAQVLVPIDDAIYVHPSDQLIHLTYSAGGLTIQALSL